MNFQDTQWDIEQTVIQPLLDFRAKVSPLNQIHNDHVTTFAKIMDGLLTGSDGEMEMQGQGSMALADLVGHFLDGEQKLSGSGPDLLGRLLDASIICEKHAHQLQRSLDQIAGQQDHSVQDLSAIALAADAGAVGQGGIDVPWDVIALGITAIAATYAATHNPDTTRAQNAELVRAGEIAIWKNDIQNGPDTEPLPQLPADPQGPTGDSGNFLRTIGIVGGIAALIAGGAIIVNLTTQQEDLAQRLHADFGSSGLSLDDIRAIIAKYPNLTEAQLRELLGQYSKVTGTHPNLVSLAGGTFELFLIFIQLSFDPAKTNKKRSLAQGIHEAEVVLGVAERGDLRWPLKRDLSGAAEVIDGNNRPWDVKGYVSGMKPPFDLARSLADIHDELFVAHENVILDVTRLSPADAKSLADAIQKNNWGRMIIWWPASPTP